MEVIRANLYTNFGYESINPVAAEAAYGALMKWLDLPTSQLAIGTTNYDVSAEDAVRRKGLEVYDGFVGSYYSPQTLDLTDFEARHRNNPAMVTVLHLHGAVGWFRPSETPGVIQRMGAPRYMPDLGTPALLLPDNRKTANSLAGAEQVWSAFEQLLDEATHVLILGHSLHDAHLVEIVREVNAQVGVCWYHSADDIKNLALDVAERDNVATILPGAAFIPCNFGPKALVAQYWLDQWLSQ